MPARPLPAFAHLAARTCYSLRDGVIRPRELARAAAQRGMDTVGVADRGGLYGAVRVAQACAAEGVTQVFGADLALWPHPGRDGWEVARSGRGGISRTMGPGSGPGWLEDDAARVVLLARTQAGLATLCRTVSDHHLESPRGDAHLRWTHVTDRLGRPDAGGVTVLLGDDSPVGRLLAAGRHDAAAEEALRWADVVGRDHLRFGVTHHRAEGDDARARAWCGLADRLDVRVVAHQQPRYLHPADAAIVDIVAAVRQQVPLALAQRGSERPAGGRTAPDAGGSSSGYISQVPRGSRRNTEGYFKTAEEMALVFAERPDALREAGLLAEACRADLGLGRLRVPDFVSAAESDVELRVRCEHGVRERFAAPGAEHRDLLERELAMVRQLKLAPYFLTVAEICDRIRAKGIIAACRGSAAGSLVCYALRISDVDPIAHDLVFERFMNPYRDELPDIDLDVESARREDIYADLLATYGEDRVACVCMVDTFKARMAIREVGKVMGLPEGEVDVIAKSFPHVRAGDVRPALAHLPELQGLRMDAAHLGLLFDVVERLDGFPRHLALHPSGVLLSDAGMRDIVPVERSAAGFAMAQYDKDDVEALGLCKLDVLAVRMLSSMAHAVDEVARVRGETLDLAAIPWADPDTYEVIRSTRTLGMFQIESPGQRELVGKFQPEHLSDLIVDISLFRPGPVKGDMIKPFLRRRHGEEEAKIPHPLLERALGETFGVIVYHEQVMRCVAAATGCDLATADLVRRRLSDPEEVPALEQWIIAGCRRQGMPEDVTQWLWRSLAEFASFGFCKAHAAAFAVPTYRSAWLKSHHLPEFVAGLLTHDPGMYPRRLLLDDARQFGVAVLPLDVNRSARDYRVERLPAAEAYALLGLPGTPGVPEVAPGRRAEDQGPAGVGGPRGWGVDAEGRPLPPSGFDLGVDPREPAWRFGVRLALQDVAGIDDAMIDSLVVGQPFASLADLRLRSGLSQPVAEALAHAGALDSLAAVPEIRPAYRSEGQGPSGVGRGPTRRDVLLEVGERWSGVKRRQQAAVTQPRQLELLEPEPPPGLPEYRASERVRAELEVIGIDATDHVIRFYDGLLDVLGVTRAVDLLATRDRQRVRVAGVKVATQTPPVKSGQRVIFLSLDDATGVSDATFFESVHQRCAWTVFHTWLLVAEGSVHRAGRRGISITADVAWDLRRLMRAWREGWLDEALREPFQSPLGRPADQAGGNHGDGAPSTGIFGAHGRSGLRLPGGPDPTAFPSKGPRDRHLPDGLAAAAAATPGGQPASGHADGAPLGAAAPNHHRPLEDELHLAIARQQAEAGSPTRWGPNGATWADPAGRHPGVDSQDVRRLSRNDPRHPDHQPPVEEADPPRKLWHSSAGSAGR